MSENSAVDVGVMAFAGVLVTAISAYLAGARSAAIVAATEREKLAAQDLHDVREWWRNRVVGLEEELKQVRLSAEAAHLRADEAEVKASDAEAQAAGYAARLEDCRERLREGQEEEARAILEGE